MHANFPSRHQLRKYFYNEDFQIYGSFQIEHVLAVGDVLLSHGYLHFIITVMIIHMIHVRNHVSLKLTFIYLSSIKDWEAC